MRKLDNNYVENLNKIIEKYEDMEKSLKEIVNKNIKELVLVGCGANYSQMLLIKHMIDGLSKKIRCSIYHGGEFERRIPNFVDKNTIVIGMSHSGNTTEIYYALKKVKEYTQSKTIAISSNDKSKIGKTADLHFSYPDGENMSEMKIITLYQLIYIIQDIIKDSFPEILKNELKTLPEKLLKAHDEYIDKARKFAEKNSEREMIYSVGCGPTIGAAFAFSNCKLMEMQWKDSGVLNASNFFHGPLEVVDNKRYFLLFKAQDYLSQHVQRVKDYLQLKNGNYDLIDTSNVYEYDHKVLKEYISPIFLWPAMTVYAWELELVTGHDLDMRRNMGKEGTEYFNY